MWWDDDLTGESNLYVGGIGTMLASHFKFTSFNNYGVGVVQEIDAAAMSLWLHYQRNEMEFEGTTALPLAFPDLEDIDSVQAGALINF